MNNTDSVGEQIKKVRTAAGLTQAELGKKTGFSAMGISYLENGQRKAKLEDLKVIADALEVPIAFLLEPVAKVSVTYSSMTLRRGSTQLSPEEEKETEESIKKFDELVSSLNQNPA